MTGYDILGNIAILKFPDKTKRSAKMKEARNLLKSTNIKTILEKSEKVHGRLRTIKTKYLAGIRTKEILYKENGCWFRLNIDSCYFSPRLSGDRLEIARQVSQKEKILVLFSGVAPYPVIIAKISHPREIVCIELGRKCCEYARENVRINKLENVKIIQGDVKRIKLKQKFDRILMPRPQLKETFLKSAFKFSKKGTTFHYYDFLTQEEFDSGKSQQIILQEARKAKKEIRILRIKRCGDLAPYKFRVRVDFKVV